MPGSARPKSSQQLGQLLIVGFDGTEMSPRLYDLLTRLQPAGVILFARNIEGPQQTHKLLKDCQACVRDPLFNCVDLEGGKVDRFRKIMGSTPSAADASRKVNNVLYSVVRLFGERSGDAGRWNTASTSLQ